MLELARAEIIECPYRCVHMSLVESGHRLPRAFVEGVATSLTVDRAVGDAFSSATGRRFATVARCRAGEDLKARAEVCPGRGGL